MISIVMATYNRARLLPRAINSVLRQTWKDWELVIVDDGSTDETQVLVESIALREPRVRLLRQAHAGLVTARNRGIAAAHGDIVTFLDSDDEYLPDHLQLRADIFASDTSIQMINGGVKVVGGPAEVPDVTRPGEMIAIANCAVGGTFFVRAEALRQLGGFRQPDFGCDYELMQRATGCWHVEAVDAETYVYHREEADSMCNVVQRR